MKTKVVLIVEAMLGGIRQHVCDIARSLDKEKYDVYMIYSDLRADDVWESEKSELESSVKLILCNEMQREIGKQDLKAYKKLKDHIMEIQPDIVHCHSSKAGIVGRLAAKHCKVKKIFYTPNAYAFQSPNLSRMKEKIYIYAERFLSKYATTMTINVSKGEMEKALEYGLDRKDKFTLIYNGIPQTELPTKSDARDALGLKDDVYYIGVTARCAEQKDPFTFLKIAEEVTQKDSAVEFVYIGDGPLENDMQKWILDRKLESKVHMLGFRKDASSIVGVLDIYLSTALYEGLPYSMIEAMRAGVPIIATDTIGNNELVFENRNGMMFPVGDVAAACKLIEKQKAEELIQADSVRETFANEFSLDTMMNKLNIIYSI